MGRSLGQHLLSTASLLRLGGGDDALCDAGALHSVYGTRAFPRAIADVALRARIAEAAGAPAELLAFLFCTLDRPRCLLSLERTDASALLPLRAQGGTAVRVPASLVEALVTLEAANLLEQGDACLAEVFSAPPHAPLRLAAERLCAAAARAQVTLPPIRLYSAPQRAPSLACCPSLWQWAARPPPQPQPQPQHVTELSDLSLPSVSAPAELPGCFLLDAELGGPLCPPHLSPSLLLPPSPLHAALPQQRAGPQIPCPAAPCAALEAGACTTPPFPPGRTITAHELRCAAASLAGAAGASALGKELAALLGQHGYFCIDAPADSEAAATVSSAFAAAARFFGQLPAQKLPACWPSGAGKKFAGFRAEGPRELFAVRDDQGQGGGAGGAAAWPEKEWRALFKLQRALSRDVLALLALGQGLDLRAGGPAETPSLAHLFGADADAGAGEAQGSSESGAAASLEACSDVMRVYRYLRPEGAHIPTYRYAATSAHADVGLLTVAPLSRVPGLVLLSPCGLRWVDVEGAEEARRAEAGGEQGASVQRFVCFLGEAGARLLAGATAPGEGGMPLLRAPVHFVRERQPSSGARARYSAPFFLRAPKGAALARGVLNGDFLQTLAQRPWAKLRGQDRDGAAWASDF